MSTILVVDNDERIQGIYKDFLEREGYEVILCSDIVDARKRLNAVLVDLILLGIDIGEYGGEILYEVARSFHKDVKVIVSSVHSIEDQKKLMPEAEDYYDKSEGTQILLSKVKNVLNNKRKDEV